MLQPSPVSPVCNHREQLTERIHMHTSLRVHYKIRCKTLNLTNTVSHRLEIPQSQVSTDSCFISPDCSLSPSIFPNGACSVFMLSFLVSLIYLFWKPQWQKWSDMIKKARGSLGSCSINHSGEGGLLDCLCPRLWCNQRVRPRCSRPETQHLMRMRCPGSTLKLSSKSASRHIIVVIAAFYCAVFTNI